MTEPQPVDVVALDADIWLAWLDVIEARKKWARCPSGENDAAHDRAELRLNKLLEFRFAASPWLTKRTMIGSK